MAELVAGAVVAEQVITTTIEGTVVAGYALSRPTLPLKATFSCINVGKTEEPDALPDSLARSNHTLNVLDGDLYVYGGLVSDSTLAGDEMHILKLSNANRSTLGSQYQVLPALSKDGEDVPCARAGHTACVIDSKLLVYGGYSDPSAPSPLEEGGRVWLFDPKTLHWSHVDIVNEKFPTRFFHAAVAHGNSIIIHGGYSSSDTATPETDTWIFSLDTRTWIQLPALNGDIPDQPSMLPTAPPNLAVANDRLYLVAGSVDLGSQVHTFDLTENSSKLWTTLQFPTNPVTKSPRPRKGAGLIPTTTGMGRTYLIFLFGEKEESSTTQTPAEKDSDSPEYWSGIWALQLPSSTTTLAQAKDVVRDTTGMDSHKHEWAEVELVVGEMETERGSGKSHPGPRAYFACDALEGKKVVLWGGLNPKGEREGDGWVLSLKI